MTRPPRPKYPSDAKNYHDLRRPGFAHTIRLPEELLQLYVNLKCALGPRTTHADVIRVLFEAAEATIQAVMQLDSPQYWIYGMNKRSGYRMICFGVETVALTAPEVVSMARCPL
ncbi:hypothetical protein R1sor_020884 [Riccia sorocarpa]|uniref:Uncharacterized protein n=1 Tax=Riccia sorocarpa TaxID=122646 RepID=A0ABD3GFH6_9MARC